MWRATALNGLDLHRGSWLLCAHPRTLAGAELSDEVHHGGGALPRRRPERCRRAHRDRADGKNPRANHGHRECRRRRRHDRQRARGRRASGRLHPARRQHGLACLRPGAHAERQIRFRARFRADRLHRACARRHRREEGFPGQGPARIRGLSEEQRRQRETGARRHRLVVAHGVPAFHLAGRSAAEPGGLSRHRPGDERPDRRPRRLLLRAGRQRRAANHRRQRSRPTAFPPASAWRCCPTCRPPRKPASTTR